MVPPTPGILARPGCRCDVHLGYGRASMPNPFCAAILFLLGAPGPASGPDLVLHHGRVVTMDEKQPSAQAVALRGDRILWVGTDAEAERRFASVRMLDLHGDTVLPGLTDAHTHLFNLGQSLSRLDLKGVKTEAEVVARVKQRAATTPPGSWIVGWGWDEGAWAAHYPDHRAL